jgi:hypothetical protein
MLGKFRLHFGMAAKPQELGLLRVISNHIDTVTRHKSAIFNTADRQAMDNGACGNIIGYKDRHYEWHVKRIFEIDEVRWRQPAQVYERLHRDEVPTANLLPFVAIDGRVYRRARYPVTRKTVRIQYACVRCPTIGTARIYIVRQAPQKITIEATFYHRTPDAMLGQSQAIFVGRESNLQMLKSRVIRHLPYLHVPFHAPRMAADQRLRTPGRGSLGAFGSARGACRPAARASRLSLLFERLVDAVAFPLRVGAQAQQPRQRGGRVEQ